MGKQRERRFFTAAESAQIWDRWQRGEGLKLIGRMFGTTSSSIFAHLRPHGGIRPALRRRSGRTLSLAEREEITGCGGRRLAPLDCFALGACGLDGEPGAEAQRGSAPVS